MFKRLTLALALALAASTLAPSRTAAQDYPAPLSPTISDYADVLDAATEARLTEALRLAREDPGTEIALVTIRRRAEYGASSSIEAFATGLFNAWGIGDADRNDGILILVATEDREMRLELGSGYPPVWDTVAENVVDNSFLPAFRDGDYARGIEAGTFAAIDRIARPFAQNRPPETESRWSLLKWIFEGPGAMIAMVGGIAALIFRKRIGDVVTRVRRCPTCGRRTLVRRREVKTAATASATGLGEQSIMCSHCDYRDSQTFIIPTRSRSSSSGGGSFGGGSSSGGGASGRW